MNKAKAAAVIVREGPPENALAAALAILGGDYPSIQAVIVDPGAVQRPEGASPGQGQGDALFSRLRALAAAPSAPAAFEGAGGPGYAPRFGEPSPGEIACGVYRGGAFEFDAAGAHPDRARLTLMRTHARNAHAALNIGVSFALKTGAEVILIAGDRVVPARGAAGAFVARLAEARGLGLVGGTLLDIAPPHRARGFGGARVTAHSLAPRPIGAGMRFGAAPETAAVERVLDAPDRLLLAVRPAFLKAAGRLDEGYEGLLGLAAWAAAGAPGFRSGWARHALAYAPDDAAGPELKPAVLAAESLRFARACRPSVAPVLRARVLAECAREAWRGRRREAAALLRAAAPFAGAAQGG